jgi:hypothetical protein
MRSHAQAVAAIALALSFYIISTPVMGADVTIRKVADPMTEVPDGDTIELIYSAQLDVDRTVFEADTSAPLNGIWVEAAGEIQEIVDTQTLIPGRGDAFTRFGEYSHHDGLTVFYGEHPEFCDLGQCGGLYEAGPGGLTLIADLDTLMPDRSTEFELLDSPVVTGEGLAFRGATFTDIFSFGFGVYADLGAGLITVADWETPTPSGSGTLLFDFFGSRIDIYAGEVFFYATNTADYQTGYYAWQAATGTYRVLRDAATVVPGTQTPFDTVDKDTFTDGTYAFVGTHGGSPDESLYADFGDGLTEIVSANELAAEWFSGPVAFLTVSAGAGTVAFTAADTERPADDRLFMYRHADRSLSSILGSGDLVDGRYVDYVQLDRRGADGESVALKAEFKDTLRTELYVASLFAPRRHLIEGPDVDGNGYGEMILLRQDPSDRSYEIQVRDASTGGIFSTIPLGTDPVYDLAVIQTPGETPRVATYTRNTSGRLLVKIYALDDGTLIRSIQLWKNMRPIAMTILSDLNGNGAPEVAAMAESSKPFVRLQVIDTDTEELLNALVHGSSLRPVDVLATQDIGAGSAPELVIMGIVRSTAKVRFIVQDAGDGMILSDFFAGFDDKAPVFDATIVDDVSGDGVPDLVLARQRLAQGKAGYEIRDLLTGASTSERMPVTDSRPVRATPLQDVTGDGKPELGLLLVAPGGASRVEIHDVSGNTRLDTIEMLAIDNATDLTTTPDIDDSGHQEVVTLGRYFDIDMLELHDIVDGTALRYYFVP